MNSRPATCAKAFGHLTRPLPLVLLLALCACRPSAATREGSAAQQSLASSHEQQSPAPQQNPNLCKGQQSPLPRPYVTGFVSDFAKIIDDATERQLEEKLARLEQDTGVEFAVVTVETTGGRDIFDYSIDVACGWGIGPAAGQRGGGMLLLVALRDRKWRVQVSRNLEADLPNDLIKEIGDRMAQSFQARKYGEGILRCVEEHIARLQERGWVRPDGD